ncbi:hypothetical protein JOF42_000520 [Microbacterium phyllosphaerae]|uniref:Uncharacterized protein n=1 Tax=Microbacterium phyllosphaerae TaxID=124798 RepID=A0ABS4WLE4_9MICO|nr:hypothetical protein [Microbacterium phyllosphaerae]
MEIVNATDTIVPIGDYTGMDLQEFAQEHPDEAHALLDDRTFKLEISSQYYYLRASGHYRSVGLTAPRRGRRRWH